MGDIGSQNKYLVEDNHDIKILNLQSEIQMRRSRIVHLTQDIEDLKELAIKQKEVEIKRLEADLSELLKRLDIILPTNAEIINIK